MGGEVGAAGFHRRDEAFVVDAEGVFGPVVDPDLGVAEGFGVFLTVPTTSLPSKSAASSKAPGAISPPSNRTARVGEAD
jgi:hypothetical protein